MACKMKFFIKTWKYYCNYHNTVNDPFDQKRILRVTNPKYPHLIKCSFSKGKAKSAYSIQIVWTTRWRMTGAALLWLAENKGEKRSSWMLWCNGWWQRCGPIPALLLHCHYSTYNSYAIPVSNLCHLLFNESEMYTCLYLLFWINLLRSIIFRV